MNYKTCFERREKKKRKKLCMLFLNCAKSIKIENDSCNNKCASPPTSLFLSFSLFLSLQSMLLLYNTFSPFFFFKMRKLKQQKTNNKKTKNTPNKN